MTYQNTTYCPNLCLACSPNAIFGDTQSAENEQKLRLDYYVFGSPMHSRTFTGNGYKFGFNGQEKEDDIYGEGNAYDFGARIYNANTGIFFSIDPKAHYSYSRSPYNFAGNSPIAYIDVNGEFKFPAAASYPYLAAYLQNNLIEILDNEKIMHALEIYSKGALDRKRIEKDIEYGEGIRIEITNLYGGALGYYPKDMDNTGDNRWFELDKTMVENVEKILATSTSDFEKEAAILLFLSTLLHEYTHVGEREIDDSDPNREVDLKYRAVGGNDLGAMFENYVWGINFSSLSDVSDYLMTPTLQPKGIETISSSSYSVQSISTNPSPVSLSKPQGKRFFHNREYRRQQRQSRKNSN